MDFAYSHNAEMMRDTLRTFMERHVLPQNAAWHRLADRGIYPLDVAAIKVVAARLQTRVLDRAIQVFGAMRLTPDTPLAYLWAWGRAMRFLDGPDEVHLRSVAREEFVKAKANRGATGAYYVLR